jgi:hypothetical protein
MARTAQRLYGQKRAEKILDTGSVTELDGTILGKLKEDATR